MNQARQWGVCTMNEFREFLGLKPFASFEEWNKQTPAWRSGICCGYTMRAILADAIALVRGDRYYTTDYTREFSFDSYEESVRVY